MSDLEPLAWGGNNLEFAPGPDGEPWIVLVTLCRMLGLGNPSQVASRLDDDEKGVITSDTLGGPQEKIIVSETAAYQIIMQSRKPQAKQFMRVVADHVKGLRKHGVALAHISEAEMAEGLADPESAVLFEMFKERIARKALERRTNEIEKRLESLGDLRNSYMSIVGWFNYNCGTVSNEDAQILGKIASKICRKRGIKIGTVKHERWGSVQSYPEAVIAEAYEQFKGRY